MMRVVAGPTNSKFTRPVAKTVMMGARTFHLFASANVPLKLDGAPMGDLWPG